VPNTRVLGTTVPKWFGLVDTSVMVMTSGHVFNYWSGRYQVITTLCLKKNIPNIFDSNLKTNYQILIIFGMNISDTTCHQMTIQFPTSPNVCFCTTWKNTTSKMSLFLPK